ncbi:GNAT family N-acetyltransferase [uncultured Gemmiger sp.]|uniref:GNAT family N-acetyltransferase n=1 Tax=uncultured Gemmiger sp. TaxID=1623490 RepID=UPI0025F80065|nr:GNAT family N-acetyltransferase [uncultured Gemmiger sp.]
MFFDTDDLKSEDIFLNLTKTTPAQPEKRWLPAYYFEICLSDGTVIGHCDLRVGHNDKTYIGGNIGYNIEVSYRGHHYAAKACRLLLLQARKHGMDYLIVTCAPKNIASARTCEIAGGRYLMMEAVPRDNELYAEGMRQVMIYRFDLS